MQEASKSKGGSEAEPGKRALTPVLALNISVSAAAFAFVFGNEADELPLIDLLILLGVLAFMLAVQCALLWALHLLLRRFGLPAASAIATKLAAAAFIVWNAYFTAFITFEAAFPIRAGLAAAVGAGALGAMLVRRWQGFALFVTCAYFGLSLGLYAYTRISMIGDTSPIETATRIESRRNVYFIGNESLPSPGAYRDVYGLDGLAHVDFLRRRGFRVLDRSYSADSSTLRSYSRILSFGRDLSLRDINRHAAFRSTNPPFASFAASGYQTQFIYHSSYFGLDPELVTYAYPERSFGACAFTPSHFFYPFCRSWATKRFNDLVFGHAFDLSVPIGRIRTAARSREPWLTIYHHGYPFHSSQLLSHDDEEEVEAFRSRVRTGADRIVQRGMERLVATIQEEDPNAVIILFGDHGAASLRGADIDDPPPPLTGAQILEDRHGVMVAVYPGDFCRQRIFEGSTTLRLVESVIRCLNGDDMPSAQEMAGLRTFYWDGEPRDVTRYAGPPRAPTR